MNWNPVTLFRAFRVIASNIWTLKDPRYWPSALQGGRQTVSTEWVSEETALNYSAVWAATRLLCGTGASLPLPLFKGLDDERREKRRDHPVWYALNQSPNPEMTAYAFRSVMWQWQVNWGNAYAEQEREGNDREGTLKYLWPIHPCRVTPKRDNGGELYYEVRDEQTGEKKDVDSWRLLHIPSILTQDGVVGHGVIEHARETVGAGIALEKAGAHALGGGNVPPVVIEHPQKWDPTQRKAFRDEWKEVYGSPTGERVGVLGGGATAKALGFSAEDSQFLETRQFEVEEVARWYGVPPHMLQHLLRATFSNIEHLGIEFVQYSLIPWLRMWEQCVWSQLLTTREQTRHFVEHNVDALLRGDSAARAAFYHQGINDGWMSRNEVRKLENLDSVPGGDTFLVQGAMVPLDESGSPEQPEAPTASSFPPADAPNSEAILAARVLKRDLGRMLTKETKAVLQAAKTDGNFVLKVDEFYAKHAETIADATNLVVDGTNLPVLVSKWCNAGKSAVLEAAGSARTKDELSAAIGQLVQSKSWQERPERAIQELAA